MGNLLGHLLYVVAGNDDAHFSLRNLMNDRIEISGATRVGSNLGKPCSNRMNMLVDFWCQISRSVLSRILIMLIWDGLIERMGRAVAILQ